MAYVKYISQTEIEYPPKNKDGIINYYLNIEKLIEDGYKILNPVEKPQTDRFYEIQYEDNDTIDEKIVWLETEKEYMARKLNERKAERLQENDEKRSNIPAIKAWFSESQNGYLLMQTPVGDIKTAVIAIAFPAILKQENIPEGIFRYYDLQGNVYPTPEISASFVPTFYERLLREFVGIDQHSTEIVNEINEATTIEEVDAIVIDYTIIGR